MSIRVPVRYSSSPPHHPADIVRWLAENCGGPVTMTALYVDGSQDSSRLTPLASERRRTVFTRLMAMFFEWFDLSFGLQDLFLVFEQPDEQEAFQAAFP